MLSSLSPVKRSFIVVVALTVLALVRAAPLSAQVCSGFAALDDTRFRVAAGAASHTYANALGVSLTAGGTVFGTASAGRLYDEGFDASAFDVGLEAGADIPAREGRVYACPLAALSVSFGPREFLLFPDHGYRRVSGALGVGLAAIAIRHRGLAVHPAGGVRLVRLSARESYRDGTGVAYRRENDTYWLLNAGVGLVFNDVLTIRPGVTVPFDLARTYAVPFGREENELSLGIEVGINFGRRAR